MKTLRDGVLNSEIYSRFLMLVAVLGIIAALVPHSLATAPAVTITVVNNSGWEIRNLYLSPPNTDDWSGNQLNGYISPGTTRAVDISWNQGTVKLVAEDQDGCFLYKTVEASGNPVWTITSDATRDCGN